MESHLSMTTETSNARGEVVAWEARDPDDGTRWVTRHASERDGWMGLGRTIRPLTYADAAPPPAAAEPMITFGIREAKALLECFGGSNTAMVVQPMPEGRISGDNDEPLPAGLYAWCDECPEEGATFLGPVDTDTDEHDTPPAAARGDVRGLVTDKLIADLLPPALIFADTDEHLAHARQRAKTILLEALAAEGVQAGEVEQRARELLAQHEQQDKTGGAPVVRRDDAIRAIAAALSQQPEARGAADLKVVEAEVLAVVPGGDSCDPQQIADDIREVFAALTGERNG